MDSKSNICLIDDDVVYHFLCKRTLELTHRVNKFTVFFNGREAIDFFSSETHPSDLPDVIFLDLNMPVMDGWQFLEEFTSIKPGLNKKIVVYIVTSSDHPDDLSKAKAIKEINGYIVKPITAKDFETILDAFNDL